MAAAARARDAGAAALRRGTFEGGADAATVEDVVRWGSAGGAQILGLAQSGTLQVGMQADLAIYRLDDPRYFGLHDMAIGPVAWRARAQKALLLNGRPIVEDDAIPGLDLDAMRHDAGGRPYSPTARRCVTDNRIMTMNATTQNQRYALQELEKRGADGRRGRRPSPAKCAVSTCRTLPQKNDIAEQLWEAAVEIGFFGSAITVFRWRRSAGRSA